MERLAGAWGHLWSLPGNNAWVLIGTVAVGAVVLWAVAGAALTSWRRYPPRRGRTRAEVIRGRRAWGVVVFLAGTLVWSAYRIEALWWLTIPVNDRALVAETVRTIGAAWVSWAWWPGVEAE